MKSEGATKDDTFLERRRQSRHRHEKKSSSSFFHAPITRPRIIKREERLSRIFQKTRLENLRGFKKFFLNGQSLLLDMLVLRETEHE